MHTFRASDGTAIAYEDIGQGRPVLLLHGLMAHSGFFARQRELADQFRLISMDLRGHGRSKIDGQPPTIAQLAEDVADLAGKLQVEEAIGVGWSLVASVLWKVLNGPAGSRFAGAVIIDMTPRVMNEGQWDLGLTREACEARTQAIRDDFSNFARNAGQAIFAQPIGAELRELANWASGEFARNDSKAVEDLWSSLVEEDFRAALTEISQPTLVVHGAHSQLYGPATAEHIERALPNARAIRFDRSGHAPHMEEPQLFNRLIRDFAASLPEVRQQETTF